MSNPTVLVVQPDPMAGLDRFATWMSENGVDVEVITPFSGDLVPTAVAHDGLIVLGGHMNALDDAQHPWLEGIRQLIRDTTARAVPTLGICLGAQLVASACGGTIAVGGRNPEIGAVRVELRDTEGDPLLGDLGGEIIVAEHHYDRIERLPDGACLLGTSNLYENQAFRCGSTTWGLQFHPEVSVDSFRTWVAGSAAASPRDAASLAVAADELAAMDEVIRGSAGTIAHRFAVIVRAVAARHLENDS